MKNKFRNERYIQQVNQNGKWLFRVRYKGVDKVFNEKDFLSSSMAYKKAIEYRNSLLVDGIILNTNKTIYEVLLESYDLMSVRQKTKSNHLTLYLRHIKDVETKIAKMDNQYITKKLNSLVETLSDDQLRRVLNLYKRINKTAIIKKYINHNVVDNVILPTSHLISPKRDEKLINDEEFNLVISSLEGLKIDYQKKMYPLLLRTLRLTGMRTAEVCALNKSDVIDEIKIYKELGSSINESLTIRPCKTKSSIRNIPLTKELKKIFKEASSLTEYDLLFCNEDGSLIDIRKVGNQIEHLASKKGVKFNLYQLRHKFSTDLILKGIDIRTIQELMGHTSSTMTLYYARSNDDLKKNAMRVLT